MVVLVGLYALPCVVLVDAVICFHTVKDRIIDWDRVNADFNTLEICLAGYQIEPGMLAYLLDSVPLLRVCVQDAVKEILRFV